MYEYVYISTIYIISKTSWEKYDTIDSVGEILKS